MQNTLTIRLFFLIIIGSISSCAKDKAQPRAPITPCDTVSVVSFSKNIIPILNMHCNGAGCHSGNTPAKNLNLEASVAYTQLMSKGYIDTLRPSYSIIYAEMNSTFNPMPPTGKLDTCSVNLIYKWITQKAKNN